MATYIEASPIGHAGDRSVMTRIVYVLRGIGVWHRGVREHARKRRNLRMMRELSNHVLRDIGLDRSELASVVYSTRVERRRRYEPV